MHELDSNELAILALLAVRPLSYFPSALRHRPPARTPGLGGVQPRAMASNRSGVGFGQTIAPLRYSVRRPGALT